MSRALLEQQADTIEMVLASQRVPGARLCYDRSPARCSFQPGHNDGH